jgi:hypothetical protein
MTCCARAGTQHASSACWVATPHPPRCTAQPSTAPNKHPQTNQSEPETPSTSRETVNPHYARNEIFLRELNAFGLTRDPFESSLFALFFGHFGQL